MKVLKYLIILTTIFVFSSCKEDWLDVNTSPNTSTTVNPSLLFASASGDYAGGRVGGDQFLPIAFCNQVWATGAGYGWGSGGSDAYNISIYSTGNTWSAVYVNAGKNLKLAIDIAEEEKPVNNNAAAQCKILRALIFYHATSIWGDIPFTEANNFEISYPKFDSQQTVLEGVVSLLDEAIAQIDPDDPRRIDGSDFYYSGDLDKWRKFAKSLKFRTLMTMVDKDPSKASAIAALVNEGDMISSTDEECMFPFYDSPGNENPKYKLINQYSGGQVLWFFANTNVFDFMEPMNDPRIPRFWDEGPEAGEGEFKAVGTGELADGTTSTISQFIHRPDAPEVFYSLSEQLLLEAEVYARGIGVAVDLAKANEKFRAGVEASLDFWQVADADKQTFMNSQLPDLTASSDPVYDIHVQQWIDLFDRPIEGWIQSRRSGPEGEEVPNLELPPQAPAGGIMRRWDYPPGEMTSNPNAPDQPHIYENLWFDL